MGRVKITARFYGPRLMRRVRTLPVEAQRLLDDALRETSDEAVEFFKDEAPELSGRLKRGITARPTKTGYTITVKAVDPETGYDYVGVTRFGHKVRRIRPIERRSEGTGRRTFRDGYLVFNSRGRNWRLKSVRGVRVRQDWVRPARVRSHDEASRRMREVGREIAKRWGD